MNPLITEIPEAEAALSDWLDELVVTGRVPQLVAELKAVRGETARARRELPAEFPLEPVLEGGFESLPPGDLRLLLADPDRLLKLSNRLLLEGGDFWAQRARRSAGSSARVAASRERLRSARSSAPAIPFAEAIPVRRRSAWRHAVWLSVPLTAAAVLAVVIWMPGVRNLLAPTVVREVVVDRPVPVPQAAVQRGWLKADSLPRDLAPSDYLDRLADLAEEASKEEAPSADALAGLISDCRLGCAHVQLNAYPTLNAEQRKWLMGKCRNWARALDEQLLDLELTGNPQKIRGELTATLQRAAKALHEESARLRKTPA